MFGLFGRFGDGGQSVASDITKTASDINGLVILTVTTFQGSMSRQVSGDGNWTAQRAWKLESHNPVAK